MDEEENLLEEKLKKELKKVKVDSKTINWIKKMVEDIGKSNIIE